LQQNLPEAEISRRQDGAQNVTDDLTLSNGRRPLWCAIVFNTENL
jgi:hypothetical protein